MTAEEYAAALADRDRTIAHLREQLAAFDPELAAFNVTRLALDDPAEIEHRLRTENWDVCLLLRMGE